MSGKRKLTILLPGATIEAMQHAVAEGRASSQGQLVQEAVTEYLTVAKRERLRQAYADAARDPAFLTDVEAVARDFDELDRESLDP